MSIGHKRSLTSVLESLRQEGLDVEHMMREIRDIIIKTMIVGQPVLSHHYKACQFVNLANNMCF
jgi:tubulin polyglutamylase TTLL6/13